MVGRDAVSSTATGNDRQPTTWRHHRAHRSNQSPPPPKRPAHTRTPPESSLTSVGAGEDRLDDVVVAGAAAQVAFQPDPHLLFGGVRVLVQQPNSSHHHPGGAVTALQAVVVH